MQTKGDLRWKYAGYCSNSWEEIILYTHSAVHGDFLPLGSQSMHLRTRISLGMIMWKTALKDEERALVIS